MPYIAKCFRDIFEYEPFTALNNVGELNYEITMKIIKYLEHKELSYQTINDIMGALEGAKQEFYRRVAIPYENKKIEENGDVYPKEFVW